MKRVGRDLLPPILMSIFPILSFYLSNSLQLSWKFLPIPLLCSITIALLLLTFFYFLTRNENKAILIDILCLFIFFSYGHLTQFLNDKIFIRISENLVLGPDKILLPVVFLIFGLLIFKIFKTKGSLDQIIFFLKVTLVFLCSFSIISIIKNEWQEGKSNSETINQQLKITDINQKETPDIYYIILDGYARQDVLKKIYNYDNSEFVSGLKKMGFFVADEAKSNYMHTYLSLPSSLNMSYLDDLPKKYGKNPTSDQAATEITYHNLVSEKFKNYGYKTISFQTWWQGTNENYPADILFKNSKNYRIAGINVITNETNMVFLQTTLVGPLIKGVWNDDLRGKVLSVLQNLPDVPYMPGRKFTLAHITIPHPPYVFTKNGEVVANFQLETGDEGIEKRGKYLDQLTFVSNQVLPILQKLISNSPRPPIIVLQSDHGPASTFGKRDDWKKNYTQEAVDERSNILYAVYFPDQNYKDFYKTITPVNTFRIIFNKYFGEKLELLPDKTFYSDYDALYGFKEVGGKY